MGQGCVGKSDDKVLALELCCVVVEHNSNSFCYNINTCRFQLHSANGCHIIMATL